VDELGHSNNARAARNFTRMAEKKDEAIKSGAFAVLGRLLQRT